jgi:hypothetical protein
MANVKKDSKDLREEMKHLKSEVKKLTGELKSATKKHQAALAATIEEAYNAGFEDGFNESIDQQTQLEEAFDDYMEKAAKSFEKDFAAKQKKAHSKKTPSKKGNTAKKAKAKDKSNVSKTDVN